MNLVLKKSIISLPIHVRMSRVSSAQVVYLTTLLLLTPFIIVRSFKVYSIFKDNARIQWSLWTTSSLSNLFDVFYVMIGVIGTALKNEKLLLFNLRIIPLNIVISITCCTAFSVISIACTVSSVISMTCTASPVILDLEMIGFYGVNIVLLTVSGIFLLYLKSMLNPNFFNVNIGI